MHTPPVTADRLIPLLLDNLQDYALFLTDPQGQIVGWTPGVQNILGYAEQEFMGHNAAMIFTPEDREKKAVEEEMSLAKATGRSDDIRWHLRKDGSRLWANGQLIALYDDSNELRGYAKLLRDETERKQMQDELRRNEERYRNLFAVVDTGFALIEVLFDASDAPCDYRFLEVNAAFEQHTGLKDATGKRMLDLAPELEKRWIDTYGHVATSGESVRFEEQAQSLGRWFEVFAFRYGDPATRQVAVLFSDVTARKSGEAALHRAHQQAEENNRIKDEFLATLSHELRSPLTAILSWANLLRTYQVDSPTQQNGLEVIERNAYAQAHLVEELLDISSILTGKLRLDLRPVTLAQVVESALQKIVPIAQGNNLQLISHIDYSLVLISADTKRIEQIFDHLLSNAIKFTPAGGRITVDVEVFKSQVQVKVSDTGRGISADFLPHVFDRFRQADASTTRTRGGLGVGLSLVQALTHAQSGTVQAHSEGEGKGATFTISFPLLAVRPDVEQKAA